MAPPAAKSIPVTWPRGALPFCTVGGVLLGILAAFVPSTQGTPPISWALSLGLLVFRSLRFFQFIIGTAVLAHTLEALYTVRICSRHRLPLAQLSGWAFSVFCVGFPSLNELNLQLKRARLAATK